MIREILCARKYIVRGHEALRKNSSGKLQTRVVFCPRSLARSRILRHLIRSSISLPTFNDFQNVKTSRFVANSRRTNYCRIACRECRMAMTLGSMPMTMTRAYFHRDHFGEPRILEIGSSCMGTAIRPERASVCTELPSNSSWNHNWFQNGPWITCLACRERPREFNATRFYLAARRDKSSSRCPFVRAVAGTKVEGR